MTTARTQPVNAFTVDLEEWFQGLTSTNPQIDRWPNFESRIVDSTMGLLDLLESKRVKATFFVLGHVAEHHPTLIEWIRERGHEIGLHGYHHRFVNRLTPDEFNAEIERGIKAVYRITGEAPLGHRAPYFSIDDRTPWALDILRQHGFTYDSSIFPTRTLIYGQKGALRRPHLVARARNLIEFPISTVRVGGYNLPIAGGFYMRTWPYAFTRWAVKRLHREGLPAIFYVHPWELDLGQPRPRVTARERITHYHGRRTLHCKLERLLDDFTFGPLSDLLGSVRE